MLSKLRHFSDPVQDQGCVFQSKLALGALRQCLGADLGDVRAVDGGTLGKGFLACIDGQCKFLKTHGFASGKRTLAKERDILACLYQSSIRLDTIEIEEQGGRSRLWLIMDQLTLPTVDLDITQILQTIKNYTRTLEQLPCQLPIPGNDNFALLIDEGWKALRNLAANRLLSESVWRYVDACFAYLERQAHDFIPYLCHGDLSPNNIMFKHSAPIVIDWEDAFWGIDGYDYLYWLTFLKNRRHLSQNALAGMPWGIETTIAILILIIIIKCEISFRSNSHMNNRVSFDERIMEIMHLA